MYSYSSSFVFPRWVFVVVAGPEETKNFSGGKCPPPDSDPFSEAESGKILADCQSKNVRPRIADSSSTKTVSLSSARTTNRFPSPRCASAIQIVRPLESTAETQPQLQAALLRLSATISLPKCRMIRHNSPMTPLLSGSFQQPNSIRIRPRI